MEACGWIWMVPTALDLIVIDNFCPVGTQDEADYLDPFQAGFRVGYSTEIVLVVSG